MKKSFQEKLAQLILEEISERLKNREYLKEILLEFSDFPPEKVAEEFLKEFESLLTGKLKQEILERLKLVFQEKIHTPLKEVNIENVELEQVEEKVETLTTPEGPQEELIEEEQVIKPLTETKDVEIFEEAEKINIAETKESTAEVGITQDSLISATETEELQEKPSLFFRKERKTDIVINEQDWLYLYGFCYAPNSEGKGYPSVELPIVGIDEQNSVIGLDYGDVRLYLSKLRLEKYVIAKTGEFILNQKEAIPLKLNHYNILNQIRANEIIVPLEFWTVKMGREKIVRTIEERYLDFLHSLIDIHDAIDWDVEVSVLDNELMKILAEQPGTTTTISRLESRHPRTQKMEVKQFEKVLFKEKEIAQKVNLTLTKVASKIKVDYIVTLDSSFLDVWKPILSVRYVVGKEKRKAFYQSILDLQNEFSKFKVMISVSSPKVHFKF